MGGKDDRIEAGERFVIAHREPRARFNETVEARQLVDPERGLDVHHVVLVAGHGNVVEEGGTDMANTLTLVNAVAENIEKDYPRVTIDTLAYLDTIGVPKTIRPRKNVAIRLCNDSVGAWTTPFKPRAIARSPSSLQAWSAVCNRLYIWDYNVNLSAIIWRRCRTCR